MIKEVALLTGIKEEKLEKVVDTFGWVDFMSNTRLIEDDITTLQLRKLDTVFKLSKDLSVAKFLRETKCLDSSRKAKDFCVEVLKHESEERLIGIFLDSNNNVLGWEVIAKGTVNECVVYPREVIERVLRHKASHLLLAHNHPADTLDFSRADKDLTQKLKIACQHIDIQLIDHIVVGKSGGSASMLEEGGL